MYRAARCRSFGKPDDVYLVLTRPEAIRELTGCGESDFCFGTEKEALRFVRTIDDRTYGHTMTIEARPKESFNCASGSPWGAYAIPVYICDHRIIDVVGYIFTCGLRVFNMRRPWILESVRKWEDLHGFSHMTYDFPEQTGFIQFMKQEDNDLRI